MRNEHAFVVSAFLLGTSANSMFDDWLDRTPRKGAFHHDIKSTRLHKATSNFGVPWASRAQSLKPFCHLWFSKGWLKRKMKMRNNVPGGRHPMKAFALLALAFNSPRVVLPHVWSDQITRRASPAINQVNQFISPAWKNRVPKSDRLHSMECHLDSTLRLAKFFTLESSDKRTLCLEFERRVEAEYPDLDEESVSRRCHRKIRHLGKALGRGWELELFGGCQELESLNSTQSINATAVVDRLKSVGSGINKNWKKLKVGDNFGVPALFLSENRSKALENVTGIPKLTKESYGEAVLTTSRSMWHKKTMSFVTDVLQQAVVQSVLDIGSSFNPLHGKFLEVTALDAVPTHPSVLQADFFEVDIQEGLTQPQVVGTKCIALAAGYYDAVLLSLVLRSIPDVRSRHEMIRRAKRTLRKDGILVIVGFDVKGKPKKKSTDHLQSMLQLTPEQVLHNFGFKCRPRLDVEDDKQRGAKVYILDSVEEENGEKPESLTGIHKFAAKFGVLPPISQDPAVAQIAK